MLKKTINLIVIFNLLFSCYYTIKAFYEEEDIDVQEILEVSIK